MYFQLEVDYCSTEAKLSNILGFAHALKEHYFAVCISMLVMIPIPYHNGKEASNFHHVFNVFQGMDFLLNL